MLPGWAHPVGDSLSTMCSWKGGTCVLIKSCRRLAELPLFLVELEWIWDGEEVINLYIADISAAWGGGWRCTQAHRRNPKRIQMRSHLHPICVFWIEVDLLSAM